MLIFKGTLGIVFAEGQMQFKPWDKVMPNHHLSIWRCLSRDSLRPAITSLKTINLSFFFLSPSQRVCPYLAHGGQGQAILQFEAKTWNSPWDPNTSHCLGQMTPSPFVLVTAWPFPSWASSLSLENWERVMQRGERQGRFLQVHLEGPLCFF